MISVSGETLAQMAYNANLFINPRSFYLPNQVLFYAVDNGIRVYSSDDYIGFSQYTNTPSNNEDTAFILSVENVKEVEKFARANRKYDVDITVSLDKVTFSCGDEEPLTYSCIEYSEWWETLDWLIFSEDMEPGADVVNFSRKERLGNISKIKEPSNSPLVLKHFRVETQDPEEPEITLIRFELGPYIDGLIRLVSKNKIKEENGRGETQPFRLSV